MQRRSLRSLTAVLLAVAAGPAAFMLLRGEDEPPTYSPLELESDPFAYDEDRDDEFEARAAAGHSHVVYAKSPGGVFETAERVAPYRERIEAVADDAGVDPGLIEAIVFLESAGRPEVTASNDLEGAVGLTQILAETGTSLLGMEVDVRASERLTRRLARARGPAEARRLRARRRAVDERFDADKSLAATGRYLEIALDELGREDLAVVSYHMGIGNLQNVLARYGDDDASYTQVFFDASPDSHPRTYRLLTSLGDDSKTYLWRVLASREIMRLYREDQAELERLAGLHSAKASREEVLHPPGSTEVFETPEDLEEAYLSGDLRPFPNDPVRYGLRRGPRMGELARRLDADRTLYRGLRPAAFAVAVYIGRGVLNISGTEAPLIVTSTVRDTRYQRRLARGNFEATRGYSLHTTGFAFDIRREYVNGRQAAAFQYMLDRLQALNLISWVREPAAIHITASSEGRELLGSAGLQ